MNLDAKNCRCPPFTICNTCLMMGSTTCGQRSCRNNNMNNNVLFPTIDHLTCILRTVVPIYFMWFCRDQDVLGPDTQEADASDSKFRNGRHGVKVEPQIRRKSEDFNVSFVRSPTKWSRFHHYRHTNPLGNKNVSSLRSFCPRKQFFRHKRHFPVNSWESSKHNWHPQPNGSLLP